MNATGVLQGLVNVLWRKPYESFFAVIVFLAGAPIATVIGASVLSDAMNSGPVWARLVFGYLCILPVLAVMLNMGDQRTSAKQLFWIWIAFSVGLTALAGFGYLEIQVLEWLTG
jgi:hypothetical protein